MSTEAELIIALVVGILISNFLPGLADSLRDACRPELFVKIAIVIMGAELGVKAADAAGFAGHIIFRGLCAIVEAYLLYWSMVYKYFRFSKEWAAPLASGISICGVSAAIRARPVVPIMVSSLVVVFTCIEMLILPFVALYFLTSEPMVAGGWMGLAVKSDGGAIATATAWNPGTCMYYQELWEAERLFDNPAADRSALSPAADARIKKNRNPPG